MIPLHMCFYYYVNFVWLVDWFVSFIHSFIHSFIRPNPSFGSRASTAAVLHRPDDSSGARSNNPSNRSGTILSIDAGPWGWRLVLAAAIAPRAGDRTRCRCATSVPCTRDVTCSSTASPVRPCARSGPDSGAASVRPTVPSILRDTPCAIGTSCPSTSYP